MWDLGAGDYTFILLDTFGDGTGAYSLTVDGWVWGSGDAGSFGSYAVTDFTVPEPGALSLIALGLLGLAAIRRRKISA